jgi:hypothetical protein
MRCRHARRHCGQLVVQEGEGIKRRPTEVALDPTRSDALRDHAEPLLSDPGDEHLGRVDPGFLGDGLHLVRIDDPRFTSDIVTQRRVGRKVDALFFPVSC